VSQDSKKPASPPKEKRLSKREVDALLAELGLPPDGGQPGPNPFS
jgi:hypothetical protein